MTLRAALEALQRHLPPAIELAERLVCVNSHTGNPEGCNTVAGMLVEAMQPLPMSLERRPGQGFGDHLSWKTAAAQAGAPATFLVGHHDTVFPPGSFGGWRVDGDRAHGPGALDMKTALCMCVAVLHALHDVGELSARPLWLVSVADEETGSTDSSPWLRELAQGARAALVFEAGRGPDVVITSRKGTAYAVAHVEGRAAHAGNAREQGRNAILRLSHFVQAAEALNGHVPGASVNVGLIEGGTSRNTVPQFARCQLDVRFEDPTAERAVLQALQGCADALHGEGFQVKLETRVTRPAWVASPACTELADRYIAHQLQAGLRGEHSARVGGGSDGNTLAALGVPTIDALGPSGAGFHTTDEYVDLSSVPRKAEALLRYLHAEAEAAPAPG